jgi:hypothetical protein
VSSLAALALLIAGVALVVAGADVFFRGLLALAARLRLPAFVVTVVLSGFELENLAAGIAANAKGLPGAAAGTFLGGTTFLAAGVAGLGALIAPMRSPWGAQTQSPAESAPFAGRSNKCTPRLREPAERRECALGQPAFLADEVFDELGTIGVVLAHVVVVDCLFDELLAGDEVIDCRGRSVGRSKERLAVDLAYDPPVDLDDGVRSDHLQVERQPTDLDCFDHVAQDVLDVLGLDASERPREDGEVEGMRLDLDLLARCDPVADAVAQLGRQGTARPFDRLGVGVEGKDIGRFASNREGEPAVAAAEL